METCEQCLEDAGLQAKEIEEVILVGGMTRMPLVQQAVADFFGASRTRACTPTRSWRSARRSRARRSSRNDQNMLLLDVTPHSLGIMIVGGYFEELIEQNTTVPDAQGPHLHDHARQPDGGEDPRAAGRERTADENELLGEFVLTGLRRRARASSRSR